MRDRALRVVADINWFGHIPTYHPLYLRAFLELGYRVASVTPRPDEIYSTDYLQEAREAGRLDVFQLPSTKASPPARKLGWLNRIPGGRAFWNMLRTSERVRHARARHRWRYLLSTIEKLTRGNEEKLIFIPYLNDLLHDPGPARGSEPAWAGLYLNSSQLRESPNSALLRSLRLFLSPRQKYVGVLDEATVTLLQNYTNGRKVGVLPDLTNEDSLPEPSGLASEVLSRAAGRPIISLLGHLTPRKGISRLCRLAKESNPDEVFFLFAGEMEELQLPNKTRNFLLSAAAGKIPGSFAHLKRVPDGTYFNGLVKISQVIYARYDGFVASSNLLTKAAKFAKPVIVSKEGCMAERVARYQTGIVFDGSEEDERAALLQLASKAIQFPLENYIEYHNDHSYSALVQGLESLEKTTLG